MWKRRMSCPEDCDSAKLVAASSLEVLYCAAPFKRSSFRKKEGRGNADLKKVASVTSFASSEIEMDNEGNSLEAQLVALQEQLVAAIIENQNLAEQVRKMRQQGSVEKLAILLANEKEKNRLLKEKFRDKECDEDKRIRDKSLPPEERSPRSRSRGRFGWRRRGLEKSKSLDQSEFLTNLTKDDDDEQQEQVIRDSKKWLNDDSDDRKITSETIYKRVSDVSEDRPSIFRRFEGWICSKLSEILKEFSVVEVEEPAQLDNEGDPLTVKKLKDNVIRFSAIMKPLSDFSSLSGSLFTWESPPATFIVFIVYMSSVLYGYLLSMVLIFAIWCLTRNYFRKRGWTISIFKPSTNRQSSESLDSGNDSKLGDRFGVVLQVARRVQNILGTLSDGSEKLKNLFLWEHEATGKLYIILWCVLLMSMLVWTYHLCTLVFLYFGIKLFIVDYIFCRFPRIRQRYSSTARLWDTLPTDADLESKNEKIGTQIDINCFLELFNLPATEAPLPGWQNGKRCTLVNRDKSITSAFRNGRLYLTKSYLCFERSKTNSDKNITLIISDVVSLEKANSYPWIPGGGMAIEVFVITGKVYFFGGIMNRDEVFDAVMSACRKGNNEKKKEKDNEKEKDLETKEKETENEKEKNKIMNGNIDDNNIDEAIDNNSLKIVVDQNCSETLKDTLEFID